MAFWWQAKTLKKKFPRDVPTLSWWRKLYLLHDIPWMSKFINSGSTILVGVERNLWRAVLPFSDDNAEPDRHMVWHCMRLLPMCDNLTQVLFWIQVNYWMVKCLQCSTLFYFYYTVLLLTIQPIGAFSKGIYIFKINKPTWYCILQVSYCKGFLAHVLPQISLLFKLILL